MSDKIRTVDADLAKSIGAHIVAARLAGARDIPSIGDDQYDALADAACRAAVAISNAIPRANARMAAEDKAAADAKAAEDAVAKKAATPAKAA